MPWQVIAREDLNGAPMGAIRRGASNRDETTDAGRGAYERSMIEFIRCWHRFGGGTARDIFAEFGLAEHGFFGRTLEMLQNGLFAG